MQASETSATASRSQGTADEAFLRTEFFAEDQLISISPMVRSGVVSLVCGNFGPFEPSVTTTVPLWLALSLKKVHRCRITPPHWLSIATIVSYISYEKQNDENLHDVPFYLFETASLLLHHAPDDLDDAPALRRSTEDLANVRDSKMRKWMQTNVRDRVNAIKVNNLSLHEINAYRPTLTQILDNLYTIHVTPQPDALLTETNTASNSATLPSETTAPTPQAGQGRQLRRVIRTDT